MTDYEAMVPPLLDPVCGKAVGIGSVFSCVRSGAMFCFCSKLCRDRFMSDPDRYVTIMAPRPGATETTRPLSAAYFDIGEATRFAEASAMLATVPAETTLSPARLSREPEVNIERWTAPRGPVALLRSWMSGYLERRYIRRACRELLSLYRRIRRERPDASDREVFKALIMARRQRDSEYAEYLLEKVEGSFGEWPVRREVHLGDVVHFLAVSEFLAGRPSEHWMREEIRRIVATTIPPEYLIEKRIHDSDEGTATPG